MEMVATAALSPRTKRLGDMAEKWAVELLRNAGFARILDLNGEKPNHEGGDFLAERRGERFFISVKARNKYQQSGALNGSYNIFPDKVRRAAVPYDAVPAWLVIQVDTDRSCYSAYFGLIDALPNPNGVGVPMTPKAVAGYECFANERACPDITADLSNRIVDRSSRVARPIVELKSDPSLSRPIQKGSGKLFTTKQMGDACEMLVAAELTLAGVPALKVPDNWPGYDVIAQPVGGNPERISVKSRTFKRGPAYVGYNDYDVFDWLAIVLLPGEQQADRRIYVIPREVAEGRARRDKPTSKTAAERYFRIDQVHSLFSSWLSNFALEQRV